MAKKDSRKSADKADIKDRKKLDKKPEKGQVIPSTEKSAEIATYYGFSFIQTPVITKDDISKTKKDIGVEPGSDDAEESGVLVHPEEKVAILRTYMEKNMHSWQQPVMLYYEGKIHKDGEKVGKQVAKQFYLDIIGTHKTVAEATLIKVTYEILKEAGYDDLIVNVNSIGDKDSANRFCKELANYYRKHIEKLSSHCKQALKKDPFEVFECRAKACHHEIKDQAPNPINFLSEPSRAHFREVLEFLETLSIPYRIHHSLICNRKIWSQTTFEIARESNQEVLAKGVRYNSLPKQIGLKKEIGAVGVKVVYKPLTKTKDKKNIVLKSPLIYFVQLGYEAKLKSLLVLEMLRQAKIPVSQSLGRDKIGVQIQSAETSRIPYTIIMGQKEAVENTVIFRLMQNRSQDIVALKDLPEYLKKIK